MPKNSNNHKPEHNIWQVYTINKLPQNIESIVYLETDFSVIKNLGSTSNVCLNYVNLYVFDANLVTTTHRVESPFFTYGEDFVEEEAFLLKADANLSFKSFLPNITTIHSKLKNQSSLNKSLFFTNNWIYLPYFREVVKTLTNQNPYYINKFVGLNTLIHGMTGRRCETTNEMLEALELLVTINKEQNVKNLLAIILNSYAIKADNIL